MHVGEVVFADQDVQHDLSFLGIARADELPCHPAALLIIQIAWSTSIDQTYGVPKNSGLDQVMFAVNSLVNG